MHFLCIFILLNFSALLFTAESPFWLFGGWRGYSATKWQPLTPLGYIVNLILIGRLSFPVNYTKYLFCLIQLSIPVNYPVDPVLVVRFIGHIRVYLLTICQLFNKYIKNWMYLFEHMFGRLNLYIQVHDPL